MQNSGILRGEKKKAEQRLRALRAEAEDASRRLREARERLQNARSKVVDRVAGGLPAYEA